MSIWLEMLGARVDNVDLKPYGTRFVSAGKGEPVVLVHGTGGHLENFSKIFHSLQEKFKVYAFDMVGYGLSEKPLTPYDIPLWGSQLTRFIKQVIGRPTFVVGHSLGGWVAAWAAFHHQSWIKKLVLLTGIGFELTEDQGQVLKNFQRSHRESCLAKEISREFIRRRLSMLVENKNSIPEEWVEVRYALYSYPETRQVMASWVDYITDLLETSDNVRSFLLNEENVSRLEMPVLFMAADHDPFTPLEVVKRVALQCRNANLHIVKGAGHWPHVEKPDEVNAVLGGFFSNMQTME
jgi:2-hydroxy-6-oxonona-2,4-dienedioate hydrolase